MKPRIPIEHYPTRKAAQGHAFVVILCGAIVALALAWAFFEGR